MARKIWYHKDIIYILIILIPNRLNFTDLFTFMAAIDQLIFFFVLESNTFFTDFPELENRSEEGCEENETLKSKGRHTSRTNTFYARSYRASKGEEIRSQISRVATRKLQKSRQTENHSEIWSKHVPRRDGLYCRHWEKEMEMSGKPFVLQLTERRRKKNNERNKIK